MSHKILPPPKLEIAKLYAKEGITISSLARYYSTSNPTIRKWLKDYNIIRKDHKQASTEANSRHRIKKKPSKEQLEDLYKNSTIDSLEQYFSVGQQTIYKWLAEYEIPIRTLSESTKLGKEKQYKDIQFSGEVLDELYDRTKPISELAKNLEVSASHIRYQLIKNGIKIEPIEPSWRSKAEIELYEYLVKEFPNDSWSNSDKSIIGPYELDIVNCDKMIAIEYCGIYWHSEGSSGKKQNYHRDKYLKSKEAGFKLITVFESDDQEKIRALLLKLLGKTSKIGARKTILKSIKSKEAMQFHREHHLHSAVGGQYHYGLYHENELMMVASFGRNRFSKKYEYECSRITSHSNYTIIGGVSKLIKHFIKTEQPKSIVTFADLRFGNGGVYPKCGFNYVEDTAPNYWYSKKYYPELFSRVKFQKHKLETLLENFDPQKTEFENMLENNWDRIWDCGNAKYEWRQ
jgi:transposase